ncbi:glycoside hydrolase family 43 protein [Amnibacterium kyonggiense]|uniref:Glycosyl hydrolase family 43 n=1 Tax=Amnibacterium kyonggiense TaxID=595671 RepID=A0A4R7FPX4_9MICO|nr:glycoside hydrolase family 43 protein [Amnibacterium kyonggiense]TDS79698.1 glycosyl hydrolase family 43 [Amnibacterium kyonggiense]
MSAEPVWDGDFADPFLIRTDDGYVGYATSPVAVESGAALRGLVSPDLRTWSDAGPVLDVDGSFGTTLWAPEVVEADGAWWMYYSAGFDIAGHHLRVARADAPTGPFVDQGVNLTPDEPFAIDATVLTDVDGARYLYYAHDVLDAERPGTHLAMRRLLSPTRLDDEVVPVLAPNADWQIYERDRAMYGRTFDWHTLEGPTVVRRGDAYALIYSGGSWEGPDYGVSYATAPSPAGPWTHAGGEAPLLLSRALTGLDGPGHNSLLQLADGSWITAYHAWDAAGTRRQLHLAPVTWDGPHPRVELDR